jgi:hypothetical protein
VRQRANKERGTQQMVQRRAGAAQDGGAVFERTHAQEVAIILSGLDCALNGDLAAYASSEITSGRRLNRLIREHAVQSPAALKKTLGPVEYDRRVVQGNVLRACRFAHTLRERLRGVTPVITPGPLTVPQWTQTQYLEFWALLIRTRVESVHFNRDWQYSFGCTFEFAVAHENAIPTFDATGAPLDVRRAVRLIRAAVRRVTAEDLEARPLQTSLERILGSARA